MKMCTSHTVIRPACRVALSLLSGTQGGLPIPIRPQHRTPTEWATRRPSTKMPPAPASASLVLFSPSACEMQWSASTSAEAPNLAPQIRALSASLSIATAFLPSPTVPAVETTSAASGTSSAVRSSPTHHFAVLLSPGASAALGPSVAPCVARAFHDAAATLCGADAPTPQAQLERLWLVCLGRLVARRAGDRDGAGEVRFLRALKELVVGQRAAIVLPRVGLRKVRVKFGKCCVLKKGLVFAWDGLDLGEARVMAWYADIAGREWRKESVYEVCNGRRVRTWLRIGVFVLCVIVPDGRDISEDEDESLREVGGEILKSLDEGKAGNRAG